MERINAKHRAMFPDQGNVGDRALPICSECEADPETGKAHLATHRCETCQDGKYLCDNVTAIHKRLKSTKDHVVVALEASPTSASERAWNLCAQHKLPLKAVEAATYRPICSECMFEARGIVPFQSFEEAITVLDSSNGAVSADVARLMASLDEPPFNADDIRASMTKWGAEETARIRAWEEREVKHVHQVAEESVQLVQEVCTRKIEVCASLTTQRLGLRASLDEFGQALADLPSEPAERMRKTLAVYAERKQLCELLTGGKISVPPAQEILKWAAELPGLSAEFDQKAPDSGGVLASAVSDAANATLSKALTASPATTATAALPALTGESILERLASRGWDREARPQLGDEGYELFGKWETTKQITALNVRKFDESQILQLVNGSTGFTGFHFDCMPDDCSFTFDVTYPVAFTATLIKGGGGTQWGIQYSDDARNWTPVAKFANPLRKGWSMCRWEPVGEHRFWRYQCEKNGGTDYYRMVAWYTAKTGRR